MENLYEIMECSEDASFEKLRQNYQKLVLRYHPDKNIDNVSNEKFVKVKKAWDILSDKKLKED
jgi:curved DNA-binding protein CbpA